MVYLIGDETDVNRRSFKNILFGFFGPHFALVCGPANSAEKEEKMVKYRYNNTDQTWEINLRGRPQRMTPLSSVIARLAAIAELNLMNPYERLRLVSSLRIILISWISPYGEKASSISRSEQKMARSPINNDDLPLLFAIMK